MTTWTTEDRENASPPHIVTSGASYEPIPFMGNVVIEDKQMSKVEIETLLKNMLGDDPQSGIKYVVLADGSVYFFKKEGDRYALCEQTSPLQEGVQATVSSGGTRNEERS